MVYSFKVQVAARRFHGYRNRTWSDVKQGDSVLVEIKRESNKVNLYSCAIKAFVGQPPKLKK